tara:strand:+ start:1885 stop:2286 length:402 start_codon:yes stop_codon:yes gene_type:complete
MKLPENKKEVKQVETVKRALGAIDAEVYTLIESVEERGIALISEVSTGDFFIVTSQTVQVRGHDGQPVDRIGWQSMAEFSKEEEDKARDGFVRFVRKASGIMLSIQLTADGIVPLGNGKKEPSRIISINGDKN